MDIYVIFLIVPSVQKSRLFFFKTLDVREARGSLDANLRVFYEVTNSMIQKKVSQTKTILKQLQVNAV